MPITIYDVSKKAGVSIATVSRVLNNSPLVKEPTRQRVLDVMAQCGYTPNAFARGLGLDTMHTIGLLCADIADAYMATAVSHIEKLLRESGYDTLLCCAGYEQKRREDMLSLLLLKRVDGVVLLGSSFVGEDDAHNRYIYDAAEHIPVIMLNGALEHPNVYGSLCDDRSAMRDAVDLLLASGKRDVLYLNHADSDSGRRKLQGYRDAHAARGLPVREELLLACIEERIAGDTIHEVRDLLLQRARDGLRFDAVATSNDNLAVAAVKYAHAAGRAIPDELQIIGYNNSALSLCCEPELSTVDNRLESLCQSCVTTLMGVLDGREMPRRAIVSGELLPRATTLPTNQKG